MPHSGQRSDSEYTIQWTNVLKSLADESRLQIIRELLRAEASVQDLATLLGIKIYNISKHLKILEGSGLVQKRKDGVQRIYFVTDAFKSKFSENNKVLDLGCCKFIFDNLKS